MITISKAVVEGVYYTKNILETVLSAGIMYTITVSYNIGDKLSNSGSVAAPDLMIGDSYYNLDSTITNPTLGFTSGPCAVFGMFDYRLPGPSSLSLLVDGDVGITDNWRLSVNNNIMNLIHSTSV